MTTLMVTWKRRSDVMFLWWDHYSMVTSSKLEGVSRTSWHEVNSLVYNRCPLYFPWLIFGSFLQLAHGYGGHVKTTRRKKSIKSISVEFNEMETVSKLWHRKRLAGVNYLTKMFFKKVPVDDDDGKKQQLVYAGQSEVVVSKNTPIIVSYNTNKQCC